MDIDDLLAEINNASSTNENKSKKKKNTKKNDTNVENTKTNTETKEIIQGVEQIKLESNTTTITTEKNEEIKTDAEVQVVEEEAKKKKRKRNRKKKTGKVEEESDDEEEKDKEDGKRENIYKSLFDFSGKEITNSRFQDNTSFLRVIKNWEDIPWNQT